MHQRSFTRRNMLKASAAAVAAPMFVPAAALGKDGAVAPSERIVMGAIGTGGRGKFDMQWLLQSPQVQLVAICDVQQVNRDNARQLVDKTHGNGDCAVFTDMRELLGRQDIDAVLIATGDRWHGPASIAAMEAGKDVYCEKPSTMSIAEGQAVVKVAEKTGRVYQTGTQRVSDFRFVFATELAKRGLLGKLHTVRAHLWPAVKDVTYNEILPAEPLPGREVIDWGQWIGQSPDRPYNSAYHRGGYACGAWGRFWDFGTGVAGWLAHTGLQCQFAVGRELSSPVHYANPGNKSGDGMVCTFDHDVKMVLQFEGGWRGTCGVRFEGTDGWVSIADDYTRPDVSDNAMLRRMQPILDDYKQQTGRSLSHMQDFLDCVKSRRQPIANANVMHRTMTTNHVVNLCLHLGRDLRWDPTAEQFIDDAEANAQRARDEMRNPWSR
ncbi:Gfo/Idh/MocA family oxidoreductase [Planctomycetales bacterium ZRK34]|nr:Gfo/Idh/MocA family oxidoreductase [Planctomycetales bacterium ZRK34]